MPVSIPPYMSNVKSFEKTVNNSDRATVHVTGYVGDMETKAHYAVPVEKADEFIDAHKKTMKKIHKRFGVITGLGTVLTGVAGFAATRKSGVLVKTLATIFAAGAGAVGSTLLGLLDAKKVHNNMLKKYDAQAMFFVKDNQVKD